jgi:hypothetical protein
MKYRIAGVVVFLSFLIASCQKELSFENIGPAPTAPNLLGDSTQLWKLVVLDSNFVDTSSVLFFRYDSQQRITKIVSYSYPLSNDSDYYSLTYNGADTFANKILEFESNALVYTNYFFYDSQMRMIKDSFVNNTIPGAGNTFYNNASRFVYNANGITNFGFTYASQAPTVAVIYDTAYYHPITVNGNLISEKDTLLPGTVGFTTYRDYSFTYDNNPCVRIKGYPRVPYYIDDFASPIDLFTTNKNNILTMNNLQTSTYAGGGPYDFRVKNILTYNSHSLISKSDVYSAFNGSFLPQNRIFYFYK